jgi:hypothetical protein
MLDLTLQHTVTQHRAVTPRALEVAGMFGLDPGGAEGVVVVPPTTLTLAPGRVVFITGASGGGKSTMLRLIREQVAALRDGASGAGGPDAVPAAIEMGQVPVPGDRAVVDGFDPAMPLAGVLRCLGLAGLGEARVMLRRPGELSEGQRARLVLAHTLAAAQAADGGWVVVLIDELGATLDRPTARAIAAGLRKWATRSSVCIVAATTHDDLLEPLCPDTVVDKGPGGAIDVMHRARDHTPGRDSP